jgi:hypothetical protein
MSTINTIESEDIANTLVTKAKELEEYIGDAFKSIDEKLIYDYVSAKPKDEKWKIGLSNESIKLLEPKLKEVRKNMNDKEPTIDRLLN